MARMLPPRTSSEFKSSAEKTLYRVFQEQLSDDYFVLHSVSWLSRDGGRNRDGEADFLIAHHKYGAMIVEVKGGTISRDGLTGEWHSQDGNGVDHPIRDPFEQATNAVYNLKAKLKETVETSGSDFHIGRAVAFPDVLVADDNLGPDAPRGIVIDSSDLPTIVRALHRAWGSSHYPAPGQAAITALVTSLRPPIELSRPGLVGAMRSEEEKLIELTAQQMNILDYVSSHRRVAVSGTAGSGKTLIAMEATRRLARQGYRVLFTCFTKALAAAVEAQLSNELGAKMTHVEVDNYHDLADRYVRKAEINAPDDFSKFDQSVYFNETLPELFQQAIGKLGPQFDAIVVDEGQDFADIWWITLEDLFPRPEDGILFVFYDENQRMFDQRGDCPIPKPHLTLTKNCRTTRSIHEAASSYLMHGSPASCDTPVGRKPVQIPVESGGEITALKKVVHELTQVERVPLDEIVILTPRAQKTSVMTEGSKLGNIELTWGDGGQNRLRCRSIASFKGMESPVVILAEPDRAHTGKQKVHLHVALTRAKHHVIVLGTLPDPETIQ